MHQQGLALGESRASFHAISRSKYPEIEVDWKAASCIYLGLLESEAVL